jgi:hypothetical protein
MIVLPNHNPTHMLLIDYVKYCFLRILSRCIGFLFDTLQFLFIKDIRFYKVIS